MSTHKNSTPRWLLRHTKYAEAQLPELSDTVAIQIGLRLLMLAREPNPARPLTNLKVAKMQGVEEQRGTYRLECGRHYRIHFTLITNKRVTDGIKGEIVVEAYNLHHREYI